MALGFPKPIRQDDPRLKGHETTYQASRGGHFPPPQQQRAQGKLYIAGEYAVVDPGQPAVIVAVDRYITVQL
ncbi:hypothetical protein ACWGOE_14100, partial [Leucobacter chromiiresistens]